MVESLSACRKLNYHKFRLAYLLTCMRHYRDFLQKQGRLVYYFELDQERQFSDVLAELSQKYTKLHFAEIDDKPVRKHFEKLAREHFAEYEVLSSPKFLLQQDKFALYLQTKKSKKLLMQDFYIWHRRKLGWLLEGDEPLGGKWSLDEQNRQKLPRTVNLSERTWSWNSDHFDLVKNLIEKYFKHNPGVLGELWLPVNNQQAKQSLTQFLERSLNNFGPYEDALTDRDDYVFHSGLSPLLNIGLLTPLQVLSELGEFIGKNPDLIQKNLNSIEGFGRQIIGWREWVRGLYEHIYDDSVHDSNFFGASKDLPEYFYTYDTYHTDLKNNSPLKLALQKVERLGWAHHIERLMILANWMTINRYNPKQCYDWFRSQFVDAFEWVMIPNVYGMGLFADGGVFATKPYVAGGNYIKKMSDYPDSKLWEKIWTDKFWCFLMENEGFFSRNPRMKMLISQRKKKTS